MSAFEFLIHAPDLGNDDKNRSARILHAVIATATAANVVALLGTIAVTPENILITLRWYGFGILTNVIYLAALRRGWLTAVGMLYMTGSFAVVLAASFAFGGLATPIPMLNIVNIVLAGLVFGQRGAIAMGVAAFIGALLLAKGETAGWLGAVDPHASRIVPYGLGIALTAGLLIFGDRLLSEALRNTRSARDQARKSRDAAEHTSKLLAEAGQNLDDMIRSMADALALVGQDGRVLRVNQALTDLIGHHDIVGKPFAELFRSEPVAGESVLFDVDGHPIDIVASRGLVIGASGDQNGVVWVLRDVRHRKEAERRLREAATAAEAANRAKSQFLANMSHELRTPLNAIIGYSEMLREELVDPSAVSDLQKIETSGKHLLSLINDILDLSKIEAGKMELHHEEFDISAACRDMAATVAPIVEKNQNRFRVDISPDIGMMRSDLVRLRQVLFNLLSNAAKFTTNGEVVLSAYRDETDVVFEVRDTGIGISDEVLARLFQPFMQADASTTRRFGGTGLGLALVQHFVRLLGGEVNATSAPQQGSTFTIRLPATPTVLHQTIDAITDLPRAEGTVVLAIDDDPKVHEILMRTLERKGIRVVSAMNGIEGLEYARKLRPRVITLDVMMPGMDGWAVLTALKADPETRDIPVAMLTIVDGEQRGRNLGAAAWLLKPVDRRKLLEVVQRLVGFSGAVLVVDDDDSLRELAVRVLTDHGCIVRGAQDGQDALVKMREQTPGMVLLDLMMPNMDGFQLLEAMRADPELMHVPVVVLTAAELGPEERARLASASKVLSKGADATAQIVAAIDRMTPDGAPHRPRAD